jgi:hypothetical protein
MAFVAKTYASDPPARDKLRRLVLWWFGAQLHELSRTLRGKSALAPDMALAELVGGAVGLAGTYQSSARRSARIRAGVG